MHIMYNMLFMLNLTTHNGDEAYIAMILIPVIDYSKEIHFSHLILKGFLLPFPFPFY